MTWKSASAYQTELWQIQHAKSTTIPRDTSGSTINSFHVVFFSRSGPPPTTSPLLPILWKWLPPIPFALNSICRELRNWCRAYWSLKSKPFVSFRQEEEWRTHHRAEQQHLSSKPPGSLLCIVQKGSTFANCSIFRQNDGPMQPVRSF